jgi:hypothetical protein
MDLFKAIFASSSEEKSSSSEEEPGDSEDDQEGAEEAELKSVQETDTGGASAVAGSTLGWRVKGKVMVQSSISDPKIRVVSNQ